MANGHHDLTLDIIDRDAPPVYGANTRWICMTCNRSKGKRSLAEMARLSVCWARWNIWKKKFDIDNWAGTMFEGLVQRIS